MRKPPVAKKETRRGSRTALQTQAGGRGHVRKAGEDANPQGPAPKGSGGPGNALTGQTSRHEYRFQTVTGNSSDAVECVISQDICKATGTHSTEAAALILNQAANARSWPKVDPNIAVNDALTVIEELGPRNTLEAMLAVQMISAHDAALRFMHRATRENQDPEIIDLNVVRATKLMRLFAEQLDAMQKLKGTAGQQKVTVEHVHVHEGGQAIVGAVSASTKPGEGDR